MLDKKISIFIDINKEVKKVTAKKDYLKEYIDVDQIEITKIEKDIKLNEAEKLINDLVLDFDKLNKDVNFKKLIKSLRETNERLMSAKNMFNDNAHELNNLIKVFPNNIVAKIAKIKIRSYYNNNKTDDENF